jgi:hypothetical protein
LKQECSDAPRRAAPVVPEYSTHDEVNSEGGDMRRAIRFLVGVAFVASGTAISQITVDTNDVKAMYAVGTTITYRNDSLTTSLNIGAPGSTSWDYSGLKSNAVEVWKSMTVASTPYAAGFPQANYALRDTAFIYPFNVASFGSGYLKGTVYNYVGLRAGLLKYGLQGSGNGYLDGAPGTPIPAVAQWVFQPASVDYDLPLTLSKTWTSDYTDSLAGVADLGFIKYPLSVVTKHLVSYSVDAYGLLTLPGSRVQPALRIRKIDRYTTTGGSSVRVEYFMVAKNGASVHFTALDTTLTSGTVAVTSIQWTIATATDVPAIADVPTSFGLNQNYPNPFNPATTIGYRISGTGTAAVRLAVYDALGREVAVLVDERKPAGEYRVSFDGSRLASGVYHYRLTSSGESQQFTETRSMLLLK